MVKYLAISAFLGGCLSLPLKPNDDAGGGSQRDARPNADAAMVDVAHGLDAYRTGMLLGGDDTVETGNDQHGAGLAEASSFHAGTPGTVNTLWVYYGSEPGNDAKLLQIGLYSNNGGNPGMLLASGAISSPSALAPGLWYGASVTPVAITANTYYWIAVVAPIGSGQTNFSVVYKYYGTGGSGACDVTMASGCTQHSAASTLSALPANWSVGTMFLPSVNSYYASADPL